MPTPPLRTLVSSRGQEICQLKTIWLDYAKSVHTRWTYPRVSSLSTYWTMLICRATCPDLTYDNMKTQIERVYSSKQPTATNGYADFC